MNENIIGLANPTTPDLGGKLPAVIREWISKEFGSVRTIIVNNKVWLVGIDIAKILGYSSPSVAVNQNLKSKYKWVVTPNLYKSLCGIEPPEDYPLRGLTFIDDVGVKSLIMYSTLKSLESLKTAILESSPLNTIDLLNMISVQNLNPIETKAVYVAKFENKLVKIGVSQDVKSRLRGIEKDTLSHLISSWNTEQMEKVKALKVERQAHEYFSSRRIQGEFFNISYTRACEKVKELYTQIA